MNEIILWKIVKEPEVQIAMKVGKNSESWDILKRPLDLTFTNLISN